ncbi:PAS-domain containing protein [Tabrizicola sp.]|uniref:PAS-domain containing protein n=1 Tax=Tabrizicola sp. TaxID=2005166 RepID=UPI003D2A5031
MIALDWLLALGLVLIALVAAIAGLLTVSAVQGPPRHKVSSIFSDLAQGSEGAQGPVFLFDGEVLVDATPAARQILSTSRARGGNWLRLVGYLSQYFPDLDALLRRLEEEGQIIVEGLSAKGRKLVMTAGLGGGLMRITLTDPTLEGRPMVTDSLAHHALSQEVEHLREALAQAPMPIWRETEAGEVVWANSAYMLKAIACLPAGKELGWPLPRLFERVASQSTLRGQRASIALPADEVAWFDLIGATSGEERLVFALPADAAVSAETALRDFMQTLTKTFAQLPTGLAIFDRQRQLQLFNPALMDLTGLPADFLSMRPSLLSVLDALRDRNMIPEPKDYRSWRRQLVEMEKAAASGLYEETWNLPDGQTFKVVGRPHPNGALALMMEDITHEVSRSRRYRSDLELGQAVIDEMDEAVAVFSASGQLVMSNLSYALMWAHDPEQEMKAVTVRAVTGHWRALSAPSALWSEAEEFISTVGNRVAWRSEARLLDGRLLSCRFAPLAGGATLAAFRVVEVADKARPVLAETGLAETALAEPGLGETILADADLAAAEALKTA